MTVTLSQLEKALRVSWMQDTAYSAADWTDKNPARGQCVVTALVVQDYLHGELLRDAVTKPYVEKHYYNLLPDGTIVDLTSSQYQADVERTPSPPTHEGHATIREKLVSDPSTAQRYALLQARVESALSEALNLEGNL